VHSCSKRHTKEIILPEGKVIRQDFLAMIELAISGKCVDNGSTGFEALVQLGYE
jgi:hypothetical protein